jgi:hypothetical protein
MTSAEDSAATFVGIFSIVGNDIQGNNWCDVIRCSYSCNFVSMTEFCWDAAGSAQTSIQQDSSYTPNPNYSMRSCSGIDLCVQPFEPTFCIPTPDWLSPRMNDLTALPHGLLSKLALLSEG